MLTIDWCLLAYSSIGKAYRWNAWRICLESDTKQWRVKFKRCEGAIVARGARVITQRGVKHSLSML